MVVDPGRHAGQQQPQGRKGSRRTPGAPKATDDRIIPTTHTAIAQGRIASWEPQMKLRLPLPLVFCLAIPLTAQSTVTSVYTESFRQGSTRVMEEIFEAKLS